MGIRIQLFLIISVATVVALKTEQLECPESAILCPSVCCCSRQDNKANSSELKADCSQKNLTKIPDNFPNDTTKIFLEDNLIEKIPTDSFLNLHSLEGLKLEYNRIKRIQKNAFANPSLVRLYLNGNFLSHLTAHTFTGLPSLEQLGLSNNPIQTVEWKTFTNLPNLRVLELCCVNNLKLFPNLTGTTNLRNIILDRSAIALIPQRLCSDLHYLEKLDLHSNAISTIPKLAKCSSLKSINFGNNKITSLEGQLFQGMPELLDLILKSNYITTIPADAFIGLDSLQNVNLNRNGLEYIHPDAFKPLQKIQELYLASNNLQDLPSDGLFTLLILDTTDNEHLEQFPSPTDLQKIEKIVTEHAYHCCEYLEKETDSENNGPRSDGWLLQSVEDSYYYPSSDHSFPSGGNFFGNRTWMYISGNSPLPSASSPFSIYGSISADYSMYLSISYDYLEWEGPRCSPQPGPFMPCSDLFGSWFLRVGVWLVFLLAIVGNAIVIVVIVFSRTKVDVARFLICNLACADFAMGIYLGFLASVDASTLGVFRKYGVHWQLSAGCGAASFLAVFSSELSIYTLSVITLERFYAIKHALHLEKRLKLKHAIIIMCFGWLFAILVASMPIFGVNSYYRYAVCLPFDTLTKGALAYVSGLMLLNGFAFVVIMACYISIYCAIQGSLAWNCNDSRIARRMSLLVFTDFICWAPIAVFGLTSAFNLKPISLHVAKILTIFVLPVNSCANPFLYTIFTKQFKKDCYMILRCFRSENIPVRQTPTPATTPTEGTSSLRRSVSLLVFPSCCRTPSSASEGRDSMLNPDPRPHQRYVYQSEVHTHCKKSRFQSKLLQSADNEEGTRRDLFKSCSCLVPFWKHKRFSKSQEDVSLKTLRENRATQKRRRHSVTDDVLFHGREGPTIILTGDNYMKAHSTVHEPSFNKQNENRYVLLDGHESSASDNITSSSSKFTIISVEVTKEYERNYKVQKRAAQSANRPSDLQMDCAGPLQKSKSDEGSPTQLNSPNIAFSDCSSPATISEYLSTSCSPGLSPTYFPGLPPPEILITHPEASSNSLSDGSQTEKDVVELGESIV